MVLDRSWPDVIRALRDDLAFRSSFTDRLRAVPYDAFPWLHARLDTRPKYFRRAPHRPP